VTKIKFEFLTDQQSQAFCEKVAAEMCRLFGISLDEAVERIDAHWYEQEILGEDDLVYHEDETFWANQIYYDQSYSWWLEKPPTPMKVRKLKKGEKQGSE
jgi:hypothetical protein